MRDVSATLPDSITYPDLTVGDLCTGAARMYGDRVAVVDGDEQATFTGLDERSRRFAAALRARGVRRGDVVALHLPSSLSFVVGYYGSLRAGAAVSPVNPLQPEAGLHAQLADTGAAVLVTDAEHAGVAYAACGDTPVRTVVVAGVPADDGTRPPDAVLSDAVPPDAVAAGRTVVSWAEFVAGTAVRSLGSSVEGADVAHIAYTGGTTGTPKGVRVLHRNVVANVCQMVAWRAGHRVEHADSGCVLTPTAAAGGAGVHPGAAVTVSVSPLFHAHALINASFLLLCGSTLVLAGAFSPARMAELVERHGATYITGSPAMWHALVTDPSVRSRDLSTVRVISSGAAPIDRGTLEAMARTFPSARVLEGYGLTEATCLVAAAPAVNGIEHKLGSVGLPVCDTEIRFRDGDRDAPPGVVGELWVRGPQVTDGYAGRPDETAEQFVDGWLRTGDLGYRDDEGFVFLVGRVKDMLIYKGYNVYPRELEDLLAGHPDIERAAVVGREVPSVGQEPVAFVVPRAGSEPDEDELLSYVADRVLPYKKVRAVRLVEALPTSPAGKVLKGQLRERV